MRTLLLIAALAIASCSSAPEKKAEAPSPAPLPAKDDTALLLTEHRTSAKVVPDHLLGIDKLPGGTIGDYESGGKKYQLFIIETNSAEDAALLLLDIKAALKDAAYIASFGGYFGTGADGPLFAFAKTKYLAGVAGLPEDKADPIARQLAAHLH